jgi:hypothetical protein
MASGGRILAIVLWLPSLATADVTVPPGPAGRPRSTAIRVACEELSRAGFNGYDQIAQRLGGGIWLQMGITGGSVYAVSDPVFDTMDAAGWGIPGVTLKLPTHLRRRPTLDELLSASDAEVSRSAGPGAFIVHASNHRSCSLAVRVDRHSRVLSAELSPIVR